MLIFMYIYVYRIYIYTCTGWNDKIVALEKTTFPFNENRFSFFVADHLGLPSCVQIPRVVEVFYHA